MKQDFQKSPAGTLAFSVGVRDTVSCGLLQENKILAQSADITVRHWRVVLKLGTTLLVINVLEGYMKH